MGDLDCGWQQCELRVVVALGGEWVSFLVFGLFFASLTRDYYCFFNYVHFVRFHQILVLRHVYMVSLV